MKCYRKSSWFLSLKWSVFITFQTEISDNTFLPIICKIKLGYIVQLGWLYFLWYFDPRFLFPYQRIKFCDGISVCIRCFFLPALGYNLILTANSSLKHSGKKLQFFSRIVYFQKRFLSCIADIFAILHEGYHCFIHFIFGSLVQIIRESF